MIIILERQFPFVDSRVVSPARAWWQDLIMQSNSMCGDRYKCRRAFLHLFHQVPHSLLFPYELEKQTPIGAMGHRVVRGHPSFSQVAPVKSSSQVRGGCTTWATLALTA